MEFFEEIKLIIYYINLLLAFTAAHGVGHNLVTKQQFTLHA